MSWNRIQKKWKVYLKENKKQYHIGGYDSAEGAARHAAEAREIRDSGPGRLQAWLRGIPRTTVKNKGVRAQDTRGT